MYIDAIGKACPMPVIMAKKELDKGLKELIIAVDNKIAVENLSRLAQTRGMDAYVTEKEGSYEVELKTAGKPEQTEGNDGASESRNAQSGAKEPEMSALLSNGLPGTVSKNLSVPSSCTSSGCGYAVFIGKDVVGQGERELGENLMKMAIYTLSQSDEVPASLLFMNSGVKLPAGEEQQIIDSLQELAEKGCEILVCGTCLNYYGLTEQLKIGTVSNMYDILGKMQAAAKVITL